MRGVCEVHGRRYRVSFGALTFAQQALRGGGSDAASVDTGSSRSSSSSLGVEGQHAGTDAAMADALDGYVEELAEAAVKAVSVLVMTPCERPMGRRSSSSSSGSGDGSSAAGSSSHVALFLFEDVVRPGVAEAVAALGDGSWRRPGRADGGRGKELVMLTGASVADWGRWGCSGDCRVWDDEHMHLVPYLSRCLPQTSSPTLKLPRPAS